jgi:hypothetical protein
MSNDYWLGLVRRWLRDGHNKIDGLNRETGEYRRLYIDRCGRLIRVTYEVLDPETFACEHISGDVVSLSGNTTSDFSRHT